MPRQARTVRWKSPGSVHGLRVGAGELAQRAEPLGEAVLSSMPAVHLDRGGNQIGIDRPASARHGQPARHVMQTCECGKCVR